MVNVVWFRRDLRLADHGALAAAAATAEPTVPLFVIDPAIWATAGPRRRSRLAKSLASLDEGIRDLGGSGLVVRTGNPRIEVPTVATAVGATAVLHTAESTPYGTARDAAVGEELTAAGIGFEPADTPFLHAPGEILTGSGSGYSVFTPYYRSWSARPTPAPIEVGRVSFVTDVSGDDVPEPEVAVLGGEGLAQAELRAFIADRITSYGSQRNRPDLAVTSRLGAALHFGEVHPRTIVAAAGSSGEAFVRQLCWRDFYADVLYRLPQARDENVDQRFDVVPWQQGPAADQMFALWAAGKTGYPFVDAGMRQLVQTGWMHNRVRMVVASFLTKDLIIDWRRGARFFLQHLEDGDVANNALGWQWTAGTGTDAAPYFRVFNPVLQGLKFDPDGDYVRTFVPELAHLSGSAAHEPWRHPDGYSHGYCDRMVDHAQAREEALRIYEAVKGTSAAK